MKVGHFAILALTVSVIGGIIFLRGEGGNRPRVEIQNDMKIGSPIFRNNERILAKYTCDGEDVSPPLFISEIAQGAESLVLIMDDPDAPAGTWVHWTMWNISPDTSEINEDSVPEGAVEGTTSFGKAGYGGPCPHSGTHRYFFKIYALDAKLELSSSADKAKLEKAMEGHIIGEAEFWGVYSR